MKYYTEKEVQDFKNRSINFPMIIIEKEQDEVIYCSVIYAEVVEDFKNGLVRIKEEYGEILNVKAIELEKQSI